MNIRHCAATHDLPGEVRSRVLFLPRSERREPVGESMRTLPRKVPAVAAVVAALVAVIAGCSSSAGGGTGGGSGGSGGSSASSSAPITIGGTLGLTGSLSVTSVEYDAVYKYWANQVNASGGLLGREGALDIL